MAERSRSVVTECGLHTSPYTPLSAISRTDIHRLEHTDAVRLLNLDEASIASHEAAGTAILDTLTRIAPSVAEGFYVKYDSLGDLAFRLYNPQHSEHAPEGAYIALSYCWRNHGNQKVYADDKESIPLPLSPEMFSGVLAQKRQNEGLWFDQGCIHQTEEQEKATTIGLMDTIYQSARSVIVALDDIELSDHEVVYLRNFINQYKRLSPEASSRLLSVRPAWMQTSPYSSVIRGIYDKILNSAWMGRAWCGHEMRLAANLVFLVRCENHDPSPKHLLFFRFGEAFLNWMLQMGLAMTKAENNLGKLSHSRESDLFAFLNARYRDNLRKSSGHIIGSPLDFRIITDTMQSIFKMGAGGNPLLGEHLRPFSANKDKLSIMLNISGVGLALKEVKPEGLTAYTRDECFRRLSLIALSAGDVRVLCGYGQYLQPATYSSTWLTMPTKIQGPPKDFLTLPRESDISIGCESHHEYIELDLSILNSFPDFCTLTPSSKSVDHATDIFTRFLDMDMFRSSRDMQITTLACIIECGWSWTLDVLANSKRTDVQQIRQWTTLARCLFEPNSAADMGPEVHNLVQLLLDFNFQPPKDWRAGLWGTKLKNSEERILVYTPSGYEGNIVLAVPNILESVGGGHFRCVWALSKADPTSSDEDSLTWTLLGKSPLMCRPAFVHALANISKTQRKQRVFGLSTKDPQSKNLEGLDELFSKDGGRYVAFPDLFQDVVPPAPKATLAAPASASSTRAGNFRASSQQVSISNNCMLTAWCEDSNGKWRQTNLNLNDILGNSDGRFLWVSPGSAGNFQENARNIGLTEDGAILQAELRNNRGEWKQSRISLDDRITNAEGHLRYLRLS